jgi:hypothetical protein
VGQQTTIAYNGDLVEQVTGMKVFNSHYIILLSHNWLTSQPGWLTHISLVSAPEKAPFLHVLKGIQLSTRSQFKLEWVFKKILYSIFLYYFYC